MVYGKLGRLGVIHPATGTTQMTELRRYLHEDVTVYSVPAPFRRVTKNGLEEMDRKVLEITAYFREFFPVDYVYFGCTSGSFIGGTGYDQHMCRQLLEKTSARGSCTTTTAVLDALRAVGAKKITMCTPYPDDVNLHEKIYFETEGFEILSLAGLQKEDPRTIPETELGEIYELVMGSMAPGSDTLFISCTGLPALPLVPVLEKELGIPVITSNLAGIWNISKFFNAYSEQAKKLGSLFLG